MRYLGYVTREFSPEEAAEIERKRQAAAFAELAAKAEKAEEVPTSEGEAPAEEVKAEEARAEEAPAEETSAEEEDIREKTDRRPGRKTSS